MDLLVTIWMHHHEVGASILATVNPPDDVMNMPSRLLRDCLLADWTTTTLFQPKVDGLFPAP